MSESKLRVVHFTNTLEGPSLCELQEIKGSTRTFRVGRLGENGSYGLFVKENSKEDILAKFVDQAAAEHAFRLVDATLHATPAELVIEPHEVEHHPSETDKRQGDVGQNRPGTWVRRLSKLFNTLTFVSLAYLALHIPQVNQILDELYTHLAGAVSGAVATLLAPTPPSSGGTAGSPQEPTAR